MAELADAHVWGACGFTVRVQFPSPAPNKKTEPLRFCLFRFARDEVVNPFPEANKSLKLYLIYRRGISLAVCEAMPLTFLSGKTNFIGVAPLFEPRRRRFNNPVSRTKKVVSKWYDFFYPNRRFGISSRFSVHLISSIGAGYHHGIAVHTFPTVWWYTMLRIDDILARKRDILVLGRMIYTFCESD